MPLLPATQCNALHRMLLQALDYVIYTAKRMGIRLHLVLSNMWQDFGGKDQVSVRWGLIRSIGAEDAASVSHWMDFTCLL